MAALSRLWALREERPAFVGATICVLAFLLAYPLVDWQLRALEIAPPFRFWDFGAYASALDRWEAGEPLYVPNEDGGYHGTYLYPPVFLLLFRPFLALPFDQAAMAWNAFSVGLLWVGLQLVVAECGHELRIHERVGLLWLALGFQPLLLSLKFAQMSPFLAAMLCFAFVGLVRGARGKEESAYASGLFTALAGTVKLAYAPVGAHLLQDRRRLLGAVGTGLALLALSLSVFGVEAHLTYLEVLAWGKGWTDQPRHPSLWLETYSQPLYVFGGWAFVLRIAGSVIVAAYALLAAGAGVDRETFALGVTAMPLLAPQADTYYLTAVLPAVVVLLAGELERDGHPIVPVVGLWLLSVHAYALKLFVDPPTWLPLGEAVRQLSPVLQPSLWGSLLLAGLAGVRVAERATWPRRADLRRLVRDRGVRD